MRQSRCARAVFVGVTALTVASSARAEGPAPGEPKAEITAWLGQTRFPASPGSGSFNETGFRLGEASFWPSRDVRLWYQYDNGLSIDNFALARADRRAAAQYAGGFWHYASRFTTRLEVGWRNLPTDGAERVGQKILRGEQVFFLGGGHSATAGAWVGSRDDGRSEWVTHIGAGLRVGDGLRLGSTVFYSRSGLAGESQWRTLVTAERTMGRASVAAGLAGGQEHSATGKRDIWDGFLKLSVPVLGPHSGHVLVRREHVQSGDTTVLALGLTVGTGRR